MSATMPRTLLIAAALLLLCCGIARAADNRVALVVGNADYQHAAHLPTPANDAQDIAATLTRLGFDVVLRQNSTAGDLQRALADFSEKSAQADIAMIYFAG